MPSLWNFSSGAHRGPTPQLDAWLVPSRQGNLELLQRVLLFVASLAGALLLTVGLVTLGLAPVGAPVVVAPIAETAELSSTGPGEEPSGEPSAEPSESSTDSAPRPAVKVDTIYVAPQATPEPVTASNPALADSEGGSADTAARDSGAGQEQEGDD